MTSVLPPPPRRTVPTASTSRSTSTSAPTKETWKAWSKRKSTVWGQTAMVKGVAISDRWGGKFNGWAGAIGSESFWPVTGDFSEGPELDKAARILRGFTVHGIERTVEETSASGLKKQRKVLKKIPSRIIREAKGLVIFTSIRSGIAPFGGAGGAGVIVSRLADGSWSAPSALSPNNLTVGAMLGVDIYDAVLVIRTEEALASFSTHKVTLGSEFAVAAGPYGSGAAVELGIDRSPVLSYVRSRGLYAGVELVAQVFITRTEENEKMYNWPGVKPGDILAGKVKIPSLAAGLHKALLDAETGRAQRMRGAEMEFEEPCPDIGDVELEEGEVLRLPPTPGQTIEEERLEEVRWKEEERRRK